MKQKYLLSMLLGGAMLTACSVEDDLNLAPVAEGTESSAPVFNVSFMDEDGLTRATYGNNKVLFEENKDLFSLYHGATDNKFNTGYQNAIYEGTFVDDEDGNSQMVLSTRSYVMPGTAIMIYPADVTYAWATQAATGAPVVRVDKNQNETTKLNTPYFSEVLKIKDFETVEDEKNLQAGYGRKYDVNLRRAAGVLNLTLKESGKITDPDMPEMKINRVEFVTAGTHKFTTAIAVKAGNDAVSKKDYPLWEKAADLDITKIIEDSETISTSDIDEETNVATFTLLPVADDFTIAGGEVLVHTNYGVVRIAAAEEGPGYEAKDEDKIWSPTGNSEKKMTTTEAVDKIMQGIWGGSSSALYSTETVKENVGKLVKATLNVDLSSVKMEDMHIRESKELIEALKVYDYLNKDKQPKDKAEVTFYLDGVEEGTFELTEEAWTALEKRLATKDNKVKIAACNEKEHGICKIVKLTKTSDEATVPAINFTRSDLNNWNFVTELQLEGTGWKLTKGSKQYESVQNLVVLEEAEMALVGSAAGDTIKVDGNVSSSVMKIVNRGTINVEEAVRLESHLENFGTINIPVSARLRMAGKDRLNNAVTLVNREAQDTKDKAADGFSTGAVINNSGDLVIVQGTGAEIYNYGVLNIDTKDAITLITANADNIPAVANAIGTPFSNKATTNRMGTIWLNEKGAGSNNLKIEKVTTPSGTAYTNYQGFVKYMSKEGKGSSYANYVVWEGKGWPDAANNSVAYIELQKFADGNKVTLSKTNGTVNSCVAAIIPEGTNIFIPSDVTLTITYAHFNGFITKAGTLEMTEAGCTSYFGVTTMQGRVDAYE